MKRTVIFGGTFDPPHREHVAIVNACKREMQPDRIIIMPTFIPPHKKTFAMCPSDKRKTMCELAFKDIDGVTVSSYEIDKAEKSYTVDTVKYLSEKYSDSELYFVLGTDMLSSFSKWHKPKEILRYVKLVLCEREGENEKAEVTLKNFESEFKTSALKLNYVGENVSSTEYKIRKMLGLETEGYLPFAVEKFIDENAIYKGDKYFDFVKVNEKKNRIEHTQGVILLALKYAKKLGVDTNKVLLSALLHDCAKYLDYKNYRDIKMDSDVPLPVVHQFLGAYVAENILNITDDEILDAIKYHTSGKENMSLIGKIIFTADMLEQTRDYDGVERLREIAEKDFESGFIECLKKSYEFVVLKGGEVYGLTKRAIDYYCK